MLHQNALQAARITELEGKLVVITKRKTRKRKRIQHSRTLEYGATAMQVAAAASVVAEQFKKACAGGDHKRAQLALKRCSNCSRTRHNVRTCKKDI
jgi:hypothetical protein